MGEQVLIVDDDVEFRSGLAMALEDAGYDVAVSWNGRAALEYLRTQPLPKVVVVDLEMPIMSGQAFCAEKERDPVLARVPVIVVSGHPELDEQPRSRSVIEWLRKPLDVAVLVSSIRRVTGGEQAAACVA